MRIYKILDIFVSQKSVMIVTKKITENVKFLRNKIFMFRIYL